MCLLLTPTSSSSHPQAPHRSLSIHRKIGQKRRKKKNDMEYSTNEQCLAGCILSPYSSCVVVVVLVIVGVVQRVQLCNPSSVAVTSEQIWRSTPITCNQQEKMTIVIESAPSLPLHPLPLLINCATPRVRRRRCARSKRRRRRPIRKWVPRVI